MMSEFISFSNSIKYQLHFIFMNHAHNCSFLDLCVWLQRDNSDLKSENNELKFRLQAMEQQSQLKDGLYIFLLFCFSQLKPSSAYSNMANSYSNWIFFV